MTGVKRARFGRKEKQEEEEKLSFEREGERRKKS